MNLLAIGTKVRRLASTSDYTNGRQGEIVAIDKVTLRYRVLWTAEMNGRPIRGGKGIRTFVKPEFVEEIR